MPLLASAEQGDGPTVVLVHGFTQTRASMADLAGRLPSRRVVRVDLPGHGASAGVSADLDTTAALVAEAAGGEPFDLVGYSLGGRVALHVACLAPPGLRRTAVLSASPGITDPEARSARLARDVALAEQLEEDRDVPAFLRRWLANPLFATLRPDRADATSRAANTPEGLADSLRRCSVGAQRWLGDELCVLDTPLLMLAGARDEPFVRAACDLAARSRGVGAAVVVGAGHVCHLERPDVTARLLTAFLDAD